MVTNNKNRGAAVLVLLCALIFLILPISVSAGTCDAYPETLSGGISESNVVKTACDCGGETCSAGKWCVRIDRVLNFECLSRSEIEARGKFKESAPEPEPEPEPEPTPEPAADSGSSSSQGSDTSGANTDTSGSSNSAQNTYTNLKKCSVGKKITGESCGCMEGNPMPCHVGQTCLAGIGCTGSAPKPETGKDSPSLGEEIERDIANPNTIKLSECETDAECRAKRGSAFVCRNELVARSGTTPHYYQYCAYADCPVGSEAYQRCLCDIDNARKCNPGEICVPIVGAGGEKECKPKSQSIHNECDTNSDCGDDKLCVSKLFGAYTKTEKKYNVCLHEKCDVDAINTIHCNCVGGEVCDPYEYCGKHPDTNAYGCWPEKLTSSKDDESEKDDEKDSEKDAEKDAEKDKDTDKDKDAEKEKDGEKSGGSGEGKSKSSKGVIMVKLSGPGKNKWVRMGHPMPVKTGEKYTLLVKATNAKCLEVKGEKVDSTTHRRSVTFLPGKTRYVLQSYSDEACTQKLAYAHVSFKAPGEGDGGTEEDSTKKEGEKETDKAGEDNKEKSEGLDYESGVVSEDDIQYEFTRIEELLYEIRSRDYDNIDSKLSALQELQQLKTQLEEMRLHVPE